jgi:hypothetical protein
MSSVPKNKTELELAIETAFDKILKDYQRVPVELSRTLGVESGHKAGLISVSDSLAYLIGWGRLVLNWHQLKADNQEVDFPATGFAWNQLGELAQHFYHTYQDWQYDDLLQEFESVTQQVLSLIKASDAEILYQAGWYNDWSQGRMIQFNTSSPMKSMRTKVRRFIKTQNLP